MLYGYLIRDFRKFGERKGIDGEIGNDIEKELRAACKNHRQYREGLRSLKSRDHRLRHSRKRLESHLIDGLASGSNNTSQVISTAKKCLRWLFDDKEKYKKCGIILLDLVPEEKVAPDLFSGGLNLKRRCVMHTVDALNQRYGKNTVFFGAMGVNQRWSSRCDQRSQHSTACWEHLPIVHA